MKEMISMDQQSVIDALGWYVETKLGRKCAGPVKIDFMWETIDGKQTGRQEIHAYVEVEQPARPKFEGTVPRDMAREEDNKKGLSDTVENWTGVKRYLKHRERVVGSNHFVPGEHSVDEILEALDDDPVDDD